MEKEFGKRLKKLRNKRGITQQELADHLHVSRSCIANYEKGERQPDMQAARKLADFFGVSMDALYGHAIANREELSPVSEKHTQLDICALSPGDRITMLSFYRFVNELPFL